jgi:diacylglycerol kinase family enzyme
VKTAAVVNARTVEGRWQRISPLLGSAETRFTKSRGHATVLTRELLAAGFRRIIAVGGDGTLNEVVNGFFENGRPVSDGACIGSLPCGSACDFARMRPLPQYIDVGRVRSDNGAERYFVNVASLGLGGEAVARQTRPYLLAAVLASRGYRPKLARLCVDGNAIEMPLLHAAIGNGRYQGGGLQVCPEASLDDGILELTTIAPLSFLELLRDLRILYSPRVYEHPKVSHFRGTRITADSREEVLLEVDGEPAGRLPAEFTVLPGALRMEQCSALQRL